MQNDIFIDKYVWESMVNLMDDDIREDIHARLAPCAKAEFLCEYMRLTPFEDALRQEFKDVFDLLT